MLKTAEFTFFTFQKPSYTKNEGGILVFIRILQLSSEKSQTFLTSNIRALLSERTYKSNKQLLVKALTGRSYSTLQRGFFYCTAMLRTLENCRLFKIRFMSIIKHPV